MPSLPARAAAVLALVLAAGCSGPAPGPQAPPFAPPEVGALGALTTPVRLTQASVAEPGVAAAPDGTLYANVWAQLFRSTDGGRSWTALRPGLQVSGDTSVAVGPDGAVHMVGMALPRDPGPRLPYVTSGDKGATWSEPVELAATGNEIDRPWVTALADGRVVAA